MLVLTSFGLVLVATALLVFGLLQDDGLTLIYISIACSLAAGIVLVVATRVNKGAARPDSPSATSATTGPAPMPPAEVVPEPAPVVEETPAAAAPVAAQATEAFAPTAAVPVTDSGEPFPIADYDDLSVGEILPLLPKLYVDELDVVEAQEKAGKNRSQITGRLAELRQAAAGAPDDLTIEEYLEQQGAGDDEVAPAAEAEAAPAPVAAAATKASSATKKVVKAAPKKAATSTKKAAAPPKKVATTAKKAAATAKKAAAPAKKTATKATAAKKAAPAKKAAAPAKKAAATTTAAAKKAAPAKKATKATKK